MTIDLSKYQQTGFWGDSSGVAVSDSAVLFAQTHRTEEMNS